MKGEPSERGPGIAHGLGSAGVLYRRLELVLWSISAVPALWLCLCRTVVVGLCLSCVCSRVRCVCACRSARFEHQATPGAPCRCPCPSPPPGSRTHPCHPHLAPRAQEDAAKGGASGADAGGSDDEDIHADDFEVGVRWGCTHLALVYSHACSCHPYVPPTPTLATSRRL